MKRKQRAGQRPSDVPREPLKAFTGQEVADQR